MQRNRRRWAALILPLVVVGCADITARRHLPSHNGPDETSSAADGASAGVKASGGQAAARARLKSVPPIPRSKPRIFDAKFNPDDLIGLAPRRAVELLGEPSQRTERFPAQIWRYEGENCVVSLMFFQDLVSEKYRTLSYLIEVSNPEDLDAQRRCIGRLFASQRAR